MAELLGPEIVAVDNEAGHRALASEYAVRSLDWKNSGPGHHWLVRASNLRVSDAPRRWNFATETALLRKAMLPDVKGWRAICRSFFGCLECRSWWWCC
jgi:hypothetical protein